MQEHWIVLISVQCIPYTIVGDRLEVPTEKVQITTIHFNFHTQSSTRACLNTVQNQNDLTNNQLVQYPTYMNLGNR